MKYKLKKYEGGSITNQLKILSYNISWEGMSDTNSEKHAKQPDGTIKIKGMKGCNQSGNKTNEQCKINVIKFIENKTDMDIIALQEAMHWEKIKLADNYDYISWTPSLEFQVTYWNNNILKLDDTDNVIFGWLYNKDLPSRGRPYTMLFFNNSICFINLHNGHNGKNTKIPIDFNHFNIIDFINIVKNKKGKVGINDIDLNGINPDNGTNILTLKIKNISNVDTLLDINKNINLSNIQNKLDKYQIIISGDFNCNPKFLFNNRKLFGNTIEPTCCDLKIQSKISNNHDRIYDHILTSYHTNNNSNPSTIVEPDVPGSDHLPIIKTVDLETSINNKTNITVLDLICKHIV